MTELLRRLHIWVGLFNLTALVVFAVTGLVVTFPADESATPVVRVVDYAAPGDFSDVEVANDILRKLAIPLIEPVPEYAVRRNAQNVLVLGFSPPSGNYSVTFLEAEKQVRIEYSRNSIGEFMNLMHRLTALDSTDLRVKLWAVYGMLSIASLLFMAATGVWLWLASRPRLWWAQASFAAGLGLFVVLWIVTN